MTQPKIPKEILYVRVSKKNRDYARSMKELFSTESNYINRLISNDRIKESCKNQELLRLEKIDILEKQKKELDSGE